jgi:hypothetical protein
MKVFLKNFSIATSPLTDFRSRTADLFSVYHLTFFIFHLSSRRVMDLPLVTRNLEMENEKRQMINGKSAGSCLLTTVQFVCYAVLFD